MVTKDFPASYIRETDPEEISSDAWRHGRRVTYVFTEDDGTSWQFTALVHHCEGWQLDDTVTCTKVHQVERKVMRWEAVP